MRIKGFFGLSDVWDAFRKHFRDAYRNTIRLSEIRPLWVALGILKNPDSEFLSSLL